MESVVTQLVSGGVSACLIPKSKLFPYNMPAPRAPQQKYEKSITDGEFKERARASGWSNQRKGIVRNR